MLMESPITIVPVKSTLLCNYVMRHNFYFRVQGHSPFFFRHNLGLLYGFIKIVPHTVPIYLPFFL